MPNGMEHVDWGIEASSKAADLKERFEAYCQFNNEWRTVIEHRLYLMDQRIKALEKDQK